MNKDLRVLFIVPYHPSPSSFIFAKRQINDLESQGIICETFYLESRFSILGIFSQYKIVSRKIKEFNPDIIHAQYGTITSYFASLFKKIPLVITFQGSDLRFTKDVSPIREKIGKILSKISANRAAHIVCVSEDLQNHLDKNRFKSTVIPSGIDINLFKKSDKTEAKNKLNLDSKKNYIFFNANNPLVKRLDIAQEVIEMNQDLHVELLSLNGNVEPDDIPNYLNASSVLLLCSDSEGSPMVVKEAMSCELPIISVNVGDVAERISDVDNCFIVEQNAKSISGKLRYIIENKISKTNGLDKLTSQQLDNISVSKKIINIYLKIKG